MTDPFSITVGTVGLGGACFQVASFIRDARRGIREVDQDLEDLLSDIEQIHAVHKLIEHVSTAISEGKTGLHANSISNEISANTRPILDNCQRTVSEIGALLKEIRDIGDPNGKHGRFDQFRKWVKQQSKEEKFNSLRKKLKVDQAALQLCLTTSLM